MSTVQVVTNEPDSGQQQPSSTSAALTIIPPSVREIHKNGWLKKYPNADRRSTPFGKVQKPEKMWIVFCIHDDVEAFLEYYENRRSAFSHQPTLSVALANCLHISPNIVVQENDFVFSITMENQSIKLAASTREQMMEWIETLRGKLTELGVLSPPNNLYSRGPEVKPVLAASRDPNSPLPPPPSPATTITVPSATLETQRSTRTQESGNTYVTPVDSVSRQRIQTPILNLPLNQLSRSNSNQSFPFPRISPSTPPLMYVREESENRTVVPNLFTFDAIAATVSPTTSVTAINAYTNVTMRNENVETASNANLSPSDINGNDATHSGIYESLCLASTATPAYVNALPTRTGIQSRRLLVANEMLRDPLRPRARSEDRNANVNGNQGVQINEGSLVENSENNRPMTLKEKQVYQLCCEMQHKAGVKLNLQKRDCVNSIAFAEFLGKLWICGWKQKDHPMLYHSFHIGDRILSVAGHHVKTLYDFNRVVRNENSSKIEFVIGRLPYGKAIAVRREREGQDLGIMREGNTAEVVEVVENGLADRHGLPPQAISVNGHSLCNWVLTEINGRSLNLFFKDCEIQDRLNAVGKDISILVQPSDFVKALKKQLRAMWNHKDYIVQ